MTYVPAISNLPTLPPNVLRTSPCMHKNPAVEVIVCLKLGGLGNRRESSVDFRVAAADINQCGRWIGDLVNMRSRLWLLTLTQVGAKC
jgi:hypothetical protein